MFTPDTNSIINALYRIQYAHERGKKVSKVAETPKDYLTRVTESSNIRNSVFRIPNTEYFPNFGNLYLKSPNVFT